MVERTRILSVSSSKGQRRHAPTKHSIEYRITRLETRLELVRIVDHGYLEVLALAQ